MTFHLVDLELGVVKVNDQSILSNFFIETDEDGEGHVVYYQIVPEDAYAVSLEIETHDTANAKLNVSDLNGTTVPPAAGKHMGSRYYRLTQKLSADERSSFQVIVGADIGTPLDWVHSTKYVRLYRMSSDTRMQSVVIWYTDKDGQRIRTEAFLEDGQYSAFLPDYVDAVDMDLTGPSDLSYLQLMGVMDGKVRSQAHVAGAKVLGEETTYDLKVWAMDGTEAAYPIVLYREDNTLGGVTVDGSAAVLRAGQAPTAATSTRPWPSRTPAWTPTRHTSPPRPAAPRPW